MKINLLKQEVKYKTKNYKALEEGITSILVLSDLIFVKNFLRLNNNNKENWTLQKLNHYFT